MRIAFIGGGNMARSLIGGLVDSGVNALDITVSDPLDAARESLKADLGIQSATSNEQALQQSDVIVLAVKPQQMQSVVTRLADQFADKLIVSIAAGILSQSLTHWANQTDVAIVRCMPNTPSLLRCGATALYANAHVSDTQKQQAQTILAAVGEVEWVEQETHLDAITALSGSGPAYFFLLMESMIDAAVDLQLPPELATRFAIQTALGAARMANEGDISPEQLRRNVTSPAGTTEAAINSFTNDKFHDIVARAMRAADHRANELGTELGEKT